jgi:capsular exopolysaccharide synthesis family protein
MNDPRFPAPPPSLNLFQQDESDSGSAARDQLVRTTLRWLRIAIDQWYVIVIAMIVCYLLAAFYYLATPRVYEARAEILVQQTGVLLHQSSGADDKTNFGDLPTYVRILSSGVVVEGAVQRISQLPPQLRLDFAGIPREDWSIVLRKNLSTQAIKLTKVIDLRYRSKSSKSAVAVVNAIVDSYLMFMEQYHKNGAVKIVQILNQERDEVNGRLKAKESELMQAHLQLGDIGIRDGEKIVHPLVQRTVQLNDAYVSAQKERMKWQAALDSIRAAVRNGEDLRQHLTAIEPEVGREIVLAALGLAPQEKELVSQIEREIVADRTELASLRQHLGDRHPKVVQLNESINDTKVYLANHIEASGRRSDRMNDAHFANMLQSMVQQELRKTTAHEQQLRQEYDVAKIQAAKLQNEIEATSIVKAEVERLRNLSNTLTSRVESLDINQNRPEVRVEVIDIPQASLRHVSPDRLVTAALSTMLGLTIGCCVVYLRDVMNDRFQSPEELKQQLGTTVLTTIRQLPQTNETKLESLQVCRAPAEAQSEAFRTLRTTLAFSDGDLNCLAISSPEPGDGKTTVTANLALSYAQTGRRTLIIDADVRKPGMTKLFELRSRPGLSDLVQSQTPIVDISRELICSSGHEKLDILPSGPRPFDPTGLLSSPRFSELLSWAVTQYEQVLVDCSPVLVASDAAIVGRLADGLMLVVQPEKNHRRAIIRAFDEVRVDGLNIVGIAVNNVSTDQGRGFFGSSGYGYGYGYGYGSGYGYGDAYTDDENADVRHAA